MGSQLLNKQACVTNNLIFEFDTCLEFCLWNKSNKNVSLNVHLNSEVNYI